MLLLPFQNNYWNGNNNYLAYMINGGDFADSTIYVIYTGASAYTGAPARAQWVNGPERSRSLAACPPSAACVSQCLDA